MQKFVVWENAITWLCPVCQTRHFQQGEEFNLDDENDCERHRLICEAILEDINLAHAQASPGAPTITFAQAEAAEAFDGLTRPPVKVTCSKCKVDYECLSEDDIEEVDCAN